ncbi:unnamed protein product [Rotaria sp. Silwood1]|nr:unnamed protein product [Rotaria sp. Silwood1]CAF1633031.1 unnamed protein product [Rotaria sp. Silwood1]
MSHEIFNKNSTQTSRSTYRGESSTTSKGSESEPMSTLNHASSINEPIRTTQNDSSKISKKLSDPSTFISQRSSLLNSVQEIVDAPVPLTEKSLLEKKLNTKLRDSNGLVVVRSDSSSPLFSLKSFEELKLKPDLLKGIFSMGFQSPSKIQEIVLRHLLDTSPIQSQSGTGKTAAFAIAILSRIDPLISTVQALILAPTYELAIQIGSVIEKMSQFLPYIQIAYAVRNSSRPKRTNMIRDQLLTEPIVIGTPGTVEDWCYKRRVIDLSKLRICCLDEADVMITIEGFQRTCVDLVRRLNPSVCQTMLFSATYSDEVMAFAREIVKNALVFRLKREKQTLDNIGQYFIRCFEPEQKFNAIEQIYDHVTHGKIIIFCRKRTIAHVLAARMTNSERSVRELTEDLDIEQRASVIHEFRECKFNVLISTDIIARGIDIDDVSVVINYDIPVTTNLKPDYDTYLHRIGRCGRFGKLGYTFSLIDSDKDFDRINAIEEHFCHFIDEITIEELTNLRLDQE